MKPGRIAILAVSLLGALLVPGASRAQQPPATATPPPQAAWDQRAPTPGEVQALFDAMVVVQAQKALALTDAQYPQFVGRLKALQDTRRRNQRARMQLIQEMQRQTNPATNGANAARDEGQLRALLKSLDDLQVKSAADVRRAFEGVDQVLDVRQQVRFRVFEEQIERRKFEFLLNARRRARTQPGTAR